MNDKTNAVAPSTPEAEELVAYLDGELDGESCAHIERKLAEDASFRRRLRALQETWELLDHLPNPAVSESFVQTTVQMVAVSAAADHQKFGQRAAKHRTTFLAICAAVAIAAAVGGFNAASYFLGRADNTLLHDLPLLDNLDVYRHVENVEFLEQLDASGLFQQEVESAAADQPASGESSDDT